MRGEDNQISRKWLYIVAPFCWLLLCLGSINVAAWLRTRPSKPSFVTETAVPMPTPLPTTVEPTTLENIASATQPTATAILSPTATPYVPPLYEADEIIQLLGPPSGSTFAESADISFFWQWPLPLTEDQQFNVYLFTEEQIALLGAIHEPNLGTSYRLQVSLKDVGITADTLYWLVQLETTQRNQPLRTSEVRTFTILASSFTP